MDKKTINVEDYELVICVDGKTGRLFEYGKDTTAYVRGVELKHEAGCLAELTVRRFVQAKEIMNGNE